MKYNTLKTNFLMLLGCLAAFAMPRESCAAPISWSDATDTTGKSQLVEGNVLHAYNLGASSSTVTGAGGSGTSSYHFTAQTFAGLDFVSTGADAGESVGTGKLAASAIYKAPVIMASTGDANFDLVIGSLAYPNQIKTGTLSLSGLTIGDDYKVQVFYNDQRNYKYLILGDGLGNTVSIMNGAVSTGEPDDYGQHAVGSFTADATTQSLTFSSQAGSIHANAILVVQTSEVAVPDVPTGVTAVPGNGKISLSWDSNNQAGFDHFVVKRSVTSNGPYAAVPGAVPTAPLFVDTNAVNGTTYYYVVSAKNNLDEESADSLEASAMPDASLNQPNIFMIYLDDLDPTFGCYDGSFGISPDADLTHTPNIDTLASTGIRYTRAYVANPVCSPSHTALLSGNYVTTIGAPHHRSHYIDQLPEGHGSLPEALSDAGYFTVNVSNGDIRWGASGKTDLNFANDSHSTKSLAKGSDPHIFQYIHDFTFTGPNDSPYCDPHTIFKGGAWTNRTPGQPFFAFVNIETGKAHGFGTGTTWANAQVPSLAVNPNEVTLPPYLEDTADWRNYVAQSLNAVSATDYVVGRFLEGLELSGEADNTLVILASDHGRATMRHKQWLYETGIHVPMIIRWPGQVAPGSVDTNLTSIIDIATTCINAGNAVRPPKMEGLDLFNADLTSRSHVFATRDGVDGIFDRSRAVVGHRFKYLRHFYPELPFINGNYANRILNPRSMTNSVSLTSEQRYFLGNKVPEEFYDLQADPFEVNNLADNPAYADELKAYRKILADWMASTGDYAPDARIGLGRDLVAYDNVGPVIATYPALLEDADGDGLSYYHELAFGLDPAVPDASNATSSVINANGEMDYTIRNLLDGARYNIETTTNLIEGNWQVFTTLDGESGGIPTTVTIPDSLSGSAGKLFIRPTIPQ
ncbi:sulfatase-like hydrolase/transferase [Pontiellaceae bacterium B12227]|nr:sulfatase-like hydrolase/transferase [Pontiellaceae bacterium B12227]